jgi:hypothetical protein
LSDYRGKIGFGDRYASLRSEYFKVTESPRCVAQASPSPVPSPPPDPKIALEQGLYDAALKCLRDSTSCKPDACLTDYRGKIGFGDRYPALRSEYSKITDSLRCAVQQTPAPSPTPDPRIAQEQRLYDAALKCIRESTACDTDTCLTQYRSGVGYADRYSSLREEYEKVKQSPRCAPPPPPPPPLVTYRTFENRDIDGGDLPGKLPHLTDVDQQVCASTCDKTKGCVGYSFGKWDRACYLKQSLPNLRYEPNSTAAIRSDQRTPPESQGGKKMEKSARIFAGNRYSTSLATSRDVCSRICDSEAACLGYQFVEGACWRYDRIDFATRDNKAQSGVKRQVAPETPKAR